MIIKEVSENNDDRDYVALSWIKDEVFANLNQVQQLLAPLSENDLDLAPLTSCAQLLQQVSGALYMVGFPSAALFAEDMKTLCNAFVNGQVEHVADSLQVLMQATLKLPYYLDIVETKGHDIPVLLMPLLNEIRETFKEKPLSETELFSSKLQSTNSPLTLSERQEIDKEGLTNLLQKLRQSVQLALIKIIQDQNTQQNFDYLIQIFNYLTRLCEFTPIATLWSVITAFIEGLSEGSIANTAQTKALLKQTDKQIKLLIDHGITSTATPIPNDLIKEFLFFISQANSSLPSIAALKEEFNLNNTLINNADDISLNKTNLNRVSASTLTSVIEALTEEFVYIKDELDLCTRNKQYPISNLETLYPHFKRISNTLDILGLQPQKEVVDTQLEKLTQYIKTNELDKSHLIGIAGEILAVELVIDHISKQYEYNQASASTYIVDEAQFAVNKETVRELHAIKEIISAYYNSSGVDGNVEEIPDLMHQIISAFVITSSFHTAAILIDSLDYINKHIINRQSAFDAQRVEILIDIIACVDYYLECLSNNQILNSKNAFHFAIKSLHDLGYELPEDCESFVSAYIKTIASTEEETTSQVVVPEREKVLAHVSPEIVKKVIEIPSADVIDADLAETFAEEIEENINTLTALLPVWIDDINNNQALIDIRRSFHTIKGSGRMVNAVVIGELGWAIEQMLNRIIDRTVQATSPVFQLIQDVITLLPELKEEFVAGKQHESEDVTYYINVAEALANNKPLPIKPASLVPPVSVEDNIEQDKSILTLTPLDEVVHEPESTTVLPVELLDTELVDIFINESKNHLTVLNDFLTKCRKSLPQPVTDVLQRAMHTLKGSALMAGITPIVNIVKPLEAFLKQCYINQWSIEAVDFELLKNAYYLLNKGISQLKNHSLTPIQGTEELVNRVIQRKDTLLAQMERELNPSESDNKATVSTISDLLARDINLLLNADTLIEKWRNHPENGMVELPALCEELNTIVKTTKGANCSEIVELCNMLLNCYDAFSSHKLEKNTQFFEVILNAHHALLNAIDQLAAAQSVSIPQEALQDLQALLDAGITPEVIEKAPIIEQASDELKSKVVASQTAASVSTPEQPVIQKKADPLDPEMVDLFLEEADDLVNNLKITLEAWLADPYNDKYLHTLQRQLHTLKGGARMCGAESLGDIAHNLEFIYEGLLNKQYHYSNDLAELLRQTHAHLQQMVEALREHRSLSSAASILDAIQLFRKTGHVDSGMLAVKSQTTSTSSIDHASSKAAVEEKEALTIATVREVLEEDSYPQHDDSLLDTSSLVTSISEQVLPQTKSHHAEQIKVSLDLLDSLINLAGETSICRSHIAQRTNDLTHVLQEMDSTIERVKDQLRRLDTEMQSQIISKHQIEHKESPHLDFDPLEMDQYSNIQQLSRSLFESASDLKDLKDTLLRGNRDIDSLLQRQGHINTELQEGLMQTHMVSLERIAPRLRRLVRQISTELEKQASFVIANLTGKMDRSVVDAIITPLEHMVRNALDHGIETPQIRQQEGKPPQGIITLDLSRDGGDIVLSLQDDGAGIDVQAVKEKAIAKGLMTPNEQLNDKKILQFIFEAGLSTAKKVTQISGRGVGLDIVHEAVKQLGGTLSVDSVQGQGTTFFIRLPINLSVTRALIIRVGEENYAIPMNSIEGITYLSKEQFNMFCKQNIHELTYGDQAYQIGYLGDLLSLEPTSKVTQLPDMLPLLLVRSGERHIALRIDELLPSNEIVVKNLGSQFLSVPAIAGATILGDGQVIIILDLGALIRTNLTKIIHKKDMKSQMLSSVKKAPLVMVVDDSVTVRKVTSRLLERQGMEIITARDGEEAISLLQDKMPDIMLLDIEMPRMDGFEVATRVRHNPKTKYLPIIMITSRSGEKHKRRAFEIGVNEYLSKPFMNVTLIKSISKFLPKFNINSMEVNE